MTAKGDIISVLFSQYYFLLGVLAVIVLAEVSPWFGSNEGPLYTQFTVRFLAVAVIFFASGQNLENKDLFQAAQSMKTHVFIQFFSFIFTPTVVRLFLFIFVFPFGLDNWIMTGLLAVSCMPPPVTSAVILVKAAKGNEAAAILNSALGSFIGIFLTPLLLLLHVGLSSTIPVQSTIFSLIGTVIIPLMLGQLARQFASKKMTSWHVTEMSQIALLFIIYNSFCDMFMQKEFTIDAQHVLVTLLIVVVIQLLLLCLSFLTASSSGKRRRTFSPEDVVAIVFCCTHKSLTLGLPLMKTLYGGLSHMSQISLPLLIYHPVQLILGALIVPYAQHWITKTTRSRPKILP